MNTPPSRTSDFLQRCLDDPPGDRALPMTIGRTSDRRPKWLREWLEGVILYQRKGLHHEMAAGKLTGPSGAEIDEETFAALLDDSLCRRFVRHVPAMVNRLLKFERIVTEEEANENVLVYFEEATDCYAQGLTDASVSLARACLEQALKEMIHLPFVSGMDLATLILTAERMRTLDAVHLQMAREVQQLGNAVLHRHPCTDEEALGAMVKVRAVVEQLYRPSEHY